MRGEQTFAHDVVAGCSKVTAWILNGGPRSTDRDRSAPGAGLAWLEISSLKRRCGPYPRNIAKRLIRIRAWHQAADGLSPSI